MTMEEGIACGVGLISIGIGTYILEHFYTKTKNKNKGE